MILITILITAMTMNNIILFDFSKQGERDKWQIVNDGVMGGLSASSFTISEKGTAVFQGTISLENNGGFASVRYNTGEVNVEGFSTLAVYLKGDGKKYQVRIRENRNDYYSYITTFQTSGEWETIEVPLHEMYPSFRGRKLNQPNFNGNTIVELTFLIGNKKAESFVLELQKALLK